MDGWKPLYQTGVSTADTTEAVAPVDFTPGPNRIWRILTVQVGIATGSTSPGACPALEIFDSGGDTYVHIPGAQGVVLASDTGKYWIFGPGLTEDTAFAAPDSTYLRGPIPELVVPKNHTLRVLLALGGTGDSVTAHITGWQRPTL